MQYFLELLGKQKKQKKSADRYQDSLSRLGNEQIKKMMERGMQMPVVSI